MLSSGQRSFKIKRKEEYEKQAKSASHTASWKTFLLGLSGLAAVMTLGTALTGHTITGAEVTDQMRQINYGLGLGNLGLAAMHVKDLVEAIVEKVSFKRKVQDINDELDLDNIGKKEELEREAERRGRFW